MAEDIPVTGSGSAAPPHVDYTYSAGRLGYPPYGGGAVASARRVSWGAIFAGTVVALVVELMLGTLGMAVALGSINSATEVCTFQGMGGGAGFWFVVTTLLALFAGGWTAGRFAGVPHRPDGLLHGVVTWGLVTLFSTWLLSNLVGGVVGGAFNVVGATLGAVGQGVSAVAREQLGEGSGANVGAEVERFLRQTGDPQLRPDALRQRALDAQGEAGQAAGEAAQRGGNAFDAIQAALSGLAATGSDVVNEVGRRDAINVIIARTELTEAQAAGLVDNWVQSWSEVRATVGPTTQQVGQTAAQVTEDVSGALGSLMFWSFAAMLLGLGAAVAGGSAGAPREVTVTLTSAGVGAEH